MSTIIQEIVKSDYNIVNKYIDLTIEEQQKITEILSSIKTNYLYDSKIHGLYHSEKVFLFAYIIAKAENLNPVDLQIITDAALYHDIGRINDCEDTLHGLCSANRVGNVINNDIYKDKENLNILKAIIDGHSVNDSRRDCFIEDYEIKESDRYYKLYNILKDADALDRNRFYSYNDCFLDERYLRTDMSKKLIVLSKEINDFYKEKLKETKNCLATPEVGEFQCFHSIGFDFFKIVSVLNNGILCKSEMEKRGINNTANFEGGNLDNYVSVVDARLINKGGTAFESFILNGISFICNVNELYSSDSKYSQSYCIENGLPYNKSFHDDEKYVKSIISPKNIENIFLSNNCLGKDVRGLMYIYNSLSYEILFDRVNHYYTNVSDLFIPDMTEMNTFLIIYKTILEDYYLLDYNQKRKAEKQLVKELEDCRININSILQTWVYKKYQIELGRDAKESITVEDIVSFELNKLGIDYSNTKTEHGNIISCNNVKTKTK
ncbi:MAG: HD domain-containing protein [Bacilli bacterium]